MNTVSSTLKMHTFSYPLIQPRIWKCFPCTASPKFCMPRLLLTVVIIRVKTFPLRLMYQLATIHLLQTDSWQTDTDDNLYQKAKPSLQLNGRLGKVYLSKKYIISNFILHLLTDW